MSVHRGGAVVAVAATPAAAWLLGRLAWDLAIDAGSPGAGVDALVAPAIVALGAVASGYLAVTALIMIAAGAGGTMPRWARMLAPRAWRRLVATAAGASLSAGLAVPALAVDSAPGWSAAGVASIVDAGPGWVTSDVEDGATIVGLADAAPGWAGSGASTGVSTTEAAAMGAASETETAATITVEAGDSLWDLTAALTGDGAAQVAAAWPLLYRENRDVIGDDPGAIVPGQVLRIPEELAR
ncbi:LysM peptidoglycan-binding domain-containing protein [Demequina salsinemoris]|uniref:LysM peptidoglycan-binding domain-containing protein n=1 Tax=Demequina salsinemoris TaxID=577470 RepID=UPI00082F36AD|nr:hypothetical protein [Demequina salsinemoris]